MGTKPVKPLNEWTASEIVAAIGGGRVTCEAVMRACLDRIAAREPRGAGLGRISIPSAHRGRTRVRPRRQARPARRRAVRRQGHHRHAAIMPTEWGTPIHRGRQPRARRRLRRAVAQGGRRPAGQDRHHRVRQPASRPDPQPARPRAHARAARRAARPPPSPTSWCRSRSAPRPPARPSGPASFCGVFGYRPTYGEHRLHGVMEASGSLDTLGILARSIEDIALYRDVLLGIAPVADRRGRAAAAHRRCAARTCGTRSSRRRAR